jgi:CheY-like chemotaxis protein
MAKEILTSQGYLVLLAHSGAQALEILETERVDIVFSDVIMPGMTGHELAIKISDEYPDILIQLSSGYVGDKNLDSLDTSSHFDVLQKPYSSEELLDKIATLSNK